MKYVALLRGINVGGKNKISMIRLAKTFEDAGLKNVKTYINSGNIIFSDNSRNNSQLVKILETAIKKDYGFRVKILIRDFENIKTIAEALPSNWTNDSNVKCDIMLLWESYDNINILNKLTIKPGIDDVKYVSGAIIWRVDRDKVTKSGMLKIVGTELYKNMTIRNCNTLRKIHALME